VRDSFGTIWQSAIMSFVVMTGDSWTTRMRVGMAGYRGGEEIIPVAFFIALYMIGNYILVNLSVAIILGHLEEKLALLEGAGMEVHPPNLLLPRIYKVDQGRTRSGSMSPASFSKSGGFGSSGSPTTPHLLRVGALPVIKLITKPRPQLPPTPPDEHEDEVRRQAAVAAVRGRRKSVGVGMIDGLVIPAAGQGSAQVSRRPSLQGESAPVEEAPAAREGIDVPADDAEDLDELHAALEPHSNTICIGGNDTPDDRGSPGALNDDGTPVFADQIRDEDEGTCRWYLKRFWKMLITPRQMYFREDETTFCCLTPDHWLRRRLILAVGTPLFDRIIDLIILANIVFLFFISPLNSPRTKAILDTADVCFTVVFIVEMLMKWIAFGIFKPGPERDEDGNRLERAYFRDFWNWPDFIVVVASLLALFIPLFATARSLRATRLMTRHEHTRIIVIAVVQAMPHVLTGLVFVIFVFFVLGVIGVKLFKGTFYRCTDPTIEHIDDCSGYFEQAVQGPIFEETANSTRRWERTSFHFDHLGSALLTLFVVTVGDDWSTIMWDGMDTTDTQRGLRYMARPYMALYFITVFILCNFFALNMMIGVLVSYFSKKKRLNDGSALLTPQQRLYVKARYAIDATLSDDLVPRDTKSAEAVHAVLTYRWKRLSPQTPVFDFVMMLVIIVNTAMIAATHEGMPTSLANAIELTNNIALSVFAIEAAVKLFAYGVTQYFSFPWNVFDFLIVVFGIVAAIVSLPGLSVFRVLRVLKMIKGTGVEKLLHALLRSVTSFANAVLLLLLTIFMYAVAGVILFGNVKLSGVMNENTNFQTVPNAMLSLYTVATAAGWSEMMDAASVQPPYCEEELDNCGSLMAGVTYFVSYMIVCAFIVLQLFVAVVVEIFLDDVNVDDPSVHAFGHVKEIWTRKFGVGAQLVPAEDVVDMLPRFPRVLTGLLEDWNGADVMNLLGDLNIPVDSTNRVLYRDVVYGIAFRKYRVDFRSMAQYINDAVMSVFSRKAFTLAEAHAIRVVQREYRAYRKRLLMPPKPLGAHLNFAQWIANAEGLVKRKPPPDAATHESDDHADESMPRAEEMGKMERTLSGLPPRVAPPTPSAMSLGFSGAVRPFLPPGAVPVKGSTIYAFPNYVNDQATGFVRLGSVLRPPATLSGTSAKLPSPTALETVKTMQVSFGDSLGQIVGSEPAEEEPSLGSVTSAPGTSKNPVPVPVTDAGPKEDDTARTMQVELSRTHSEMSSEETSPRGPALELLGLPPVAVDEDTDKDADGGDTPLHYLL